MNYSINQLRDNRTPEEARHNYQWAQSFELRVMKGLVAELSLKGIDSWYEKIDENEKFDGLKLHVNPDFYLYADRVYTLEIKGSKTGNWKNNTIFVKPYSIKTMATDPKYPNGLLLVATETHYAKMPIRQVMSYECKPIPNWSTDEKTKYGYIIPEDDFDWKKWDKMI